MSIIKSISRIFPVLLLAVSLAFGALGVTPAYASDKGMSTLSAATWYVATTGNDSNSCSDPGAACLTINGALGKAAAGDTIEVATGTYIGTGTEVVLIDKAITLSGGWDAGFATQNGLSTIDGEAARQGIYTSGNPVMVGHFRIQHGYNPFDNGGGISNDHGVLTLNNSIVSNNASDWDGGGIYSFGTLTINNTTISGNRAHVGGSGGGGGGGIESFNSTVTLNNSTVSGNTLDGDFDGSGINGGMITLNNSTVTGNTGGAGDGIYTFVGNIVLNNSTITNNESRGFRNSAGQVSLQNTIVAMNGTDGDCYSPAGSLTSNGYNLIGDSTGCTFTPTTGDQVGSSVKPINPLLGPLQDNGGPTFTYALLAGSPALGTGNPATPGSGGSACLATDQRGIDRAANSPCDIGAYEVDGPLVVSIKRANPSPTGAPQIDFTVTFSESVTGVDTVAPFSDFALTTTGVTGASIAAVSGAVDTYTVTVNTGLGNGTIRLDIVDNDTIQSTSSRPLGGTGAGNGNFTTGETYSIANTHISSIVRADANPTNAASIHFTLTFIESVTGINTTAPFSDFSLTTTSVTGAFISAVSGAGNTYSITVNTGSRNGNGTIRLNVIDDDSIQDASGNPLGGPGSGNGNYTTGQTYTIRTIPTPIFPAGTITDPTPTYKWTKIPGATQYQYQLFKGATGIYTKTVASSTCGSVYCLNTPTNSLANAAYKWRVKALINGVWKNYSAYKTFTLPPPPKAGFWRGDTDFYVATNSKSINHYAIYFNVRACYIYNRKLVYTASVPIVNHQFKRTGAFYFSGTFNSATVSIGYVGLNNYYIPGCGYIVGGPYRTTDTWMNSGQPSSTDAQEFTLTVVAPELNAPSVFYDFGVVKP